MSDYWSGLLEFKKSEMKQQIGEETKKKLTRILFLGNVAGARNVRYVTRLEALHNDIACLINDEEPIASQKMVEATRLPDRCWIK